MTEHRSGAEGAGRRDAVERARHEELLRGVLHAEVDGLATDHDALRRIQSRTATAPRRRRYFRPLLVLGTAAAVAVGGTLVGLQLTGDDTAVLKTPRFAQGGSSPRPSDTAVPTTSPSPTQSQPAPPATATGPVVAIWPYQTDAYAAQLAAKRQPWMSDAKQVALRFVGSYLGVPAVDKVISVSSSADIPSVVLGKTSANGKTVPVTTVALIQERGVYGVVAATADGLAITTPKDKAGVSSPLTVTGTIVGVDESICSYVKPASSPATAKSCVGGGGGLGGAPPGDWTTTLRFAPSQQRSAALVASTDDASGAPGPTRLVARLVVLGTGTSSPAPSSPTPTSAYPAAFVGVQDSRIAVFSAKDGSLVRYLTTRQSGVSDTAPVLTADAKTVYFLRGSGSCGTGLYRVPTNGSGRVEVLTRNSASAVTGFAAANDGRLTALTEHDCSSGADVLTVAPTDGRPGHEVASFPAEPPEFTSPPSFSPDDQLVAIGEGTNTAVRHITIYPVSGSAQATVPCPTSAPCRQTFPVYDSSGALTYLVDQGQTRTAVRLTNGKLSTLFTLPAGEITSFDLTADGTAAIWSDGSTTYRWSGGQVAKIAGGANEPNW